MKITRRILDALTNTIYGLMSRWKVLQVIIKIDGKHQGGPEETWVAGGGIEILCIYFFYGAKVRKNSVREKIEQCERNLIS